MPISVEDGQRLIELEAHIKRLEQGAPPTATSSPPLSAPPAPTQTGAIAPVQEGGAQRALASRTPFKELGTVPQTDVALPFQRPSVLPSQMEAPLEEKTFVGESDLGQMAGQLLVPGPLKPFAGAIGAGAGEGLRQYREGEPFDWRKVANEAGWSLLPDVAESVGRHAIRQFARNTPGGIRIRGAQAAEEARGVPGRVFQSRPAAEIGDTFEQVRRSGLNIDTEDIANHLRTLSPGKQADTLNILTNLDREHKTGGRYAQLYQDLMSGQGMQGSSVGDLQNLRSVLRQRAEELRTGSQEARQLVRDLQSSVDDTIDFGLTSGAMASSAPQVRDMLHGARREWANHVAATDLGDIIENKISSTPNLADTTFRLSSFADEIRRGRSEASKSINRSLDLTPGARDRFNTELKEMSRLYQSVEMSLSDVSSFYRAPMIAGIRQGIGQVLLTDTGRRWFHNAITEGRGRLSPNALALLASMGRRDIAPGLAQQWPLRPQPQQESSAAPGGVARSTD